MKIPGQAPDVVCQSAAFYWSTVTSTIRTKYACYFYVYCDLKCVSVALAFHLFCSFAVNRVEDVGDSPCKHVYAECGQ